MKSLRRRLARTSSYLLGQISHSNFLFLFQVKAVKNFVAPGEGPRFRKRDRIEFIARKAVKNAKAVGSYIRGGQGRKRRDMAKLVKKVFMKNAPDSQSQMVRPGLPEMFLEEEGAFEAEGGRLPEAFILVMKNLRVFGHFDECILIELMKNIKYVTLRPNDYLFKIGDADENMYIVETGELKVYYDQVSHDGELKSIELKKVKPGEPIVSLLSFLDYLAGNRKLYKTVSCRAGKAKDTKVIKFNFSAFKSAFDLYPEHLLKVVQVVMVRLQRVTLLALLQYLGLSAELINTQNRGASSAPPVLRKQYSAEDAAVNQESGGLPIPGSSNAGGNNSQLVASPQTSSSNDESFISNAFRSKKKIEKLSDEQLSGLAAESFKNLLGLTDEDFVDNDDADLITDIDLESYKEGDKIVEEDSMSRSCLFLVLQGSVVVSQGRVGGSAKDMHKANPGGLLGQLQVLTNEPSFFTYRAKTDCRLAVLSAENVRKCMKAHPYIGIRLAMHVIDNLSPYVRSIDFALEWMQVESGKAIYHQGDLADCTYVILSGRLRSVIKVGKGSGAKKELVKEYGRGELTGIVETLLQTPRSTTVIAVRDTEVAKLPAGLIDVIKLKFPSVMDRLMKLLCA